MTDSRRTRSELNELIDRHMQGESDLRQILIANERQIMALQEERQRLIIAAPENAGRPTPQGAGIPCAAMVADLA